MGQTILQEAASQRDEVSQVNASIVGHVFNLAANGSAMICLQRPNLSQTSEPSQDSHRWSAVDAPLANTNQWTQW